MSRSLFIGNKANIATETQIELFISPPSTAFYSTPSPHPPDLLLRLKNGMDSAEPSSNNISASNLHRLATMLEDYEYARHARETMAAFESEIEQFPWTFTGLLGSMVRTRLGCKGVVSTGQEQKQVMQKLRRSIGVGRTVTRLGNGKDEWLRQRNALVRSLDGSKDAVFVCEGHACKEGLQYL